MNRQAPKTFYRMGASRCNKRSNRMPYRLQAGFEPGTPAKVRKVEMDTQSIRRDLLIKLNPQFTPAWAERFLNDLCRLAEVHGPELKELIDSIQLCVCGHPITEHEERTHEVERGSHYCHTCRSIHDIPPSEEMKAAMAKAVFDNDYADLERLRAQPTPPKPSGFREELAEEREHRERMEQRLAKLNEENRKNREKAGK